MKSKIKFLLASFFLFPCVCSAQQIDPALTAAVVLQTEELQNAYKKRQTAQEQLIATQAAITLALDRIHAVESKVLEYSANASSAMDNLYQLKKATDLVSTKIPNQIKLLSAAFPENMKVSAITALTSKTISEVSAEMASLFSFMSNLVTSTSYSFSDSSDSEKKNVNLLSASERYYIANETVTRLEKAYRKLYNLTWQIEHLGWKDLWYATDRESFRNAERGKDISEQLINKWKKTKF